MTKMTWNEFAAKFATENNITIEQAKQSPKAKLEYLNYAAVRILNKQLHPNTSF